MYYTNAFMHLDGFIFNINDYFFRFSILKSVYDDQPRTVSYYLGVKGGGVIFSIFWFFSHPKW